MAYEPSNQNQPNTNPAPAPVEQPKPDIVLSTNIAEIEQQVKSTVSNAVKNSFNSTLSTVSNNIDKNGSKMFKLSVRGWIALILVVTFCASDLFKIQTSDFFESLVMMAVSFYLGHSTAQASNNNGK